MSMYNQFDTDPDLEVDGIWVDYGDFRVLMGRAGGANKKYLSYSELKTKPFRRAIQAGTMTEERSRALLYDIYSKTIILDWQISDGVDDEGNVSWKRGIHGKDGEILEFSQSVVLQTFRNLPSLFQDLQQVSDNIALFRKEEIEADSKNS